MLITLIYIILSVVDNKTCTNTTECEDIGGVCENDLCVCAAGMAFVAKEFKCVPGKYRPRCQIHLIFRGNYMSSVELPGISGWILHIGPRSLRPVWSL